MLGNTAQDSISRLSSESNQFSNTASVEINPKALKEDKMNITIFDETIVVTHEKTITRTPNDFTYIGSTSDSFENVWIAYYDGAMRLEMTFNSNNYTLKPIDDISVLHNYAQLQ